jgi:tetratricopeptide (TPR) repeat protein
MRVLRPAAAPSSSTRSLAALIRALGQALYSARRYEEALAAYAEVISLDPDYKVSYGYAGLPIMGSGISSMRALLRDEAERLGESTVPCLGLRQAGAPCGRRSRAVETEAAFGDSVAYQYATIYAQWGDRAKALEWLETAWRLRDPGLDIPQDRSAPGSLAPRAAFSGD